MNYTIIEKEDFEILFDKNLKVSFYFEIKLSNNDDLVTTFVKTKIVNNFNDLPKNISELINQNELIKNYIKCYPNDFFIWMHINLYQESTLIYKTFFHESVNNYLKIQNS